MQFIQKVQRRLRNEESGFTLIELLIVLVILAILIAIAVPSYLGFKDRANQRAAQSNVRAAIPSAEAIYSDLTDYTTLSLATMTAVDSGLSQSIVVFGDIDTYCISETKGGKFSAVLGPGGTAQKTTAHCANANALPPLAP